MYQELIRNKKLNKSKLIEYGFIKEDDHYLYTKTILNDYTLKVIVTNNTIDTQLYDTENEEYILYKTKSQGNFVGEVRESINNILEDIINHCFEIDIFKQKQTQLIIEYIQYSYGDSLEYLWKKFPDNAVVRRQDNNKWYLAIMTISKRKLNIDSDEIVEIIDLRMDKEEKESILSQEHYYPGWHMNKNSWYTIILDESIDIHTIYELIDKSYRLAK